MVLRLKHRGKHFEILESKLYSWCNGHVNERKLAISIEIIVYQQSRITTVTNFIGCSDPDGFLH